jgi:addiction module HigA family antidote
MNDATPPAHPGVILLEKAMKPLGVSRNKLARDIDVPVGRISDIVSGKRGISPDTALRLAKYFGTSAEMWMRLQWEYDLYVARVTVWPRIDPRVRVFEPSEEAPHGGRGVRRHAVEPVMPDLPDPVLPGTGGSVPEPTAALAEPASEDEDPVPDELAAEPVGVDAPAADERPVRPIEARVLPSAPHDRFRADVAVAERPATVVPDPPSRVAAAAAVAEIARQAAAAAHRAGEIDAGAPDEQAENTPEAPSHFDPEPIAAPAWTDQSDPASEPGPAAPSAREWEPLGEPTAFAEPPPDPSLAVEAALTSIDDTPSIGADDRLEKADPAVFTSEPITAVAMAGATFEPAAGEDEFPSEISLEPLNVPEPIPAAAVFEVGPIPGENAPVDIPYGAPDVAVTAMETPHSIEMPQPAIFEEPRDGNGVAADAAQTEPVVEPPALAETSAVTAAHMAEALGDVREPHSMDDAAPLTLVDEVEPPLLEDVGEDEPLLLTEELPSLDIPEPDEARYRVRRGVD